MSACGLNNAQEKSSSSYIADENDARMIEARISFTIARRLSHTTSNVMGFTWQVFTKTPQALGCNRNSLVCPPSKRQPGGSTVTAPSSSINAGPMSEPGNALRSYISVS